MCRVGLLAGRWEEMYVESKAGARIARDTLVINCDAKTPERISELNMIRP